MEIKRAFGYVIIPIIISFFWLITYTTPAISKTIETSNQYKIISERNIFRPLWNVSADKTDDRSRKEELAALQKAEEERQRALNKAEEQNLINSKKQEYEQNYKLTGIVLDNGKHQAIIQDPNGSAHMLYENDMLVDLKIVSINEAKSEVLADYQGKFTVKFRME